MERKRRKATMSTIEPLLRLRDGMRTLQREADKLLQRVPEQQGSEPATNRPIRRTRSGIKLRGRLTQRARRATAVIEGQREDLLARFERQLAERLDGLLQRLDLPSRRDIERLSRRVSKLEERLAAPPAARRARKR